MLEILLFEDSKMAIEYFKEHSIEEAFSKIESIRKLIINEAEIIEIDHAMDIAGLNYKNNIDAISQLARAEVRLLQVKYYLDALKFVKRNPFMPIKQLTWKI